MSSTVSLPSHSDSKSTIMTWRDPGRLRALGVVLGLSLLMGGCSLFPKPSVPTTEPGISKTEDGESTVRRISMQTPLVRTYRKLGARHIYDKYGSKIYKGKIPPLVYAVVVVETDVDANGNVKLVTFSRTPSHAPEVPPKIAEMIKAASPFPKPDKVGPHTYVDTWLWDRSDRFQLDTLTEGQLTGGGSRAPARKATRKRK